MTQKRKKEDKEKKGDPTGWYNYVVGGSIPPVPTRVVIKTKKKREAKTREEKRREEQRREKKRREEKRRKEKRGALSL